MIRVKIPYMQIDAILRMLRGGLEIRLLYCEPSRLLNMCRGGIDLGKGHKPLKGPMPGAAGRDKKE